MIPAAPFEVLQHAAHAHASAANASQYMLQIQGLLAESLPELERVLARVAGAGPEPLPASAGQLVLAGGKALGIKHGRHLDYNALASKDGYNYRADEPGALVRICHKPVNPKAHMSNLLLLMAQRMGVETDKFGDSNQAITL